MRKPFDVTLKHLVEEHPVDGLMYAGWSAMGPIDLLDADLAAVSAAADKVLRVHEPHPWLAHLEFQAGYERDLAVRLLRYNVLLTSRHGLPVRSVIVLLRREADGPELTGELVLAGPDGRPYLNFQYRVVRAWEKSVEDVLSGGLGTLPLAPLADVTREELPDVIRRMGNRLRQEATPAEAATFWTATYLLMGLRYSGEEITQLLRGVRDMRESVTYQAILAEGRVEGRAEGRAEGKVDGLRAALLGLGGELFGAADEATRAAIKAITEPIVLQALIVRATRVSNWAELLPVASPPRRGRKRKNSP